MKQQRQCKPCSKSMYWAIKIIAYISCYKLQLISRLPYTNFQTFTQRTKCKTPTTCLTLNTWEHRLKEPTSISHVKLRIEVGINCRISPIGNTVKLAQWEWLPSALGYPFAGFPNDSFMVEYRTSSSVQYRTLWK